MEEIAPNNSIMNRAMLLQALKSSFVKLSPKHQLRNPVMFVVFVGSILCTLCAIINLQTHAEPTWFVMGITAWLWCTVLFANAAESIAEGKGKAQAEHLKKSRRDIQAKRIEDPAHRAQYELISATELTQDDYVYVEAGDLVPGDGQVVEGIASVDESAITGESAPVIRESGGDRDAVTGGTRVLSDWLIIRITSNPGETFLDRMISLVEGAKRQKTPNEIALSILLAAMTILFLLVTVTLLPFSMISVERTGQGAPVSITILIALLVCLAPTTIGGLLSAIGIAGMNRLIRANVIATSGRAVEAAGDTNVLLLDKTGTITHGNRQAVAFIPGENITTEQLAEAALFASVADETPEGRSIVALAKSKFGINEPDMRGDNAQFIPFTAETRVSGMVLGERNVIKGAGDAIEMNLKKIDASIPLFVTRQADIIARQGGTPLIVAEGKKVLGVIHLKDIIKAGIKERLVELRKMGIKSIMITGDNPLTAAAIAAEAGVDDFLAQATPETKLKYIRQMQAGGEMVAMVGDGTNDAPALAQANVALAMNSGTQAAKEAGNMVDLDSNPTKLIEIVEIGKQLLMTRGALTTFSIANDIAKYFAIIPAAFASTYPALGGMNVMGLHNSYTAILSAVIFNAVIIIALVPLALKGVAYRPIGAIKLLRHNLLVYGLGGVFVPFIGIKLIDMILTLFVNIF